MSKEKGGAAVPAALAVNTAAFLLGSAAGLCLVGCLQGRGSLIFDCWLESFSLGLTARTGEGVSVLTALWHGTRWPVFIWLLGFTAPGTWMVPTMFALRGFFLCFSVAALFGAVEGGPLLALLAFGLSALAGLPVFFFLGVRSWARSVRLCGRLLGPPEPLDGGEALKSALALGLAACLAIAERWLIPALLAWTVPLLTVPR